MRMQHSGIKGQKWGVRRFQNADRTWTEEGKKRYSGFGTVFVSGSSKTQDPESPYYRKELPKEIQKELNSSIKKKEKIVVGDAPGIDRQVQDYLKDRGYNNVEVYGPGKNVRYSASSSWKTRAIDDPEHEPYSPEWLRKKDEFMTDISDRGLAVILDEGSKATRNNVERLISQNKEVKVFMLDKKHRDQWTDPDMATSPTELVNSMQKKIKYKNFDKLMTPEEVQASKSGSCHDQVMYELKKLQELGLSPKALFVMESSGIQGGMTHSLVYFYKNNKVYWVENAWTERAGVHAYNTIDDIKKEIKKAHASGEFGDKTKYSDLSFGDFNANAQKPGETLQELVDNIKWY